MGIDLGNLEYQQSYARCLGTWGWDITERGTGKNALGGIVGYKGKWSGRRALAADIRDHILPRLNAWLDNPDYTLGSTGAIDLGVTTDIQNGVAVEVYKIGVDGESEGDVARATIRHDNGTDRDVRLVAHIAAVRDVLAAKFG